MAHAIVEIHKTTQDRTKTVDGEKKKVPTKVYYSIIKSSGNGEGLFTSQMYTTKGACKGGIAAAFTLRGNVMSQQDIIDKTGE